MWPDDRQQIDAGTLVIEHETSQADGACRDINFDPTILPDGLKTRTIRCWLRVRRPIRFPITAALAKKRCVPTCIIRAERRPVMKPTLHISARFALAALDDGAIVTMLFVGIGMVATVSHAHMC